MTHDYKRNGALDLFAALNVGSGEVLPDTRRSHTGRDVLAFFRWIELHVDPDLELHVIWTTCRPTRASLSVTGWPTRNAAAGTCTSPRPARHGSTSSSAGSPCAAAKP
ncbi:MAG: hypothetical protein ACYDC5_06595 [Candidatus Dormibacteria bacterium]